MTKNKDRSQEFGSFWTELKLEALVEYLQAYTIALKNKGFRLWYIDAFAGSGYRTGIEIEDNAHGELELALFQDLQQVRAGQVFEGSAIRALDVDPSFAQYVFIEKKAANCQSLLQLQRDRKDRRIEIRQGDANERLRELCQSTQWKPHNHRGVVFIDPFALHLEWETLQAVAKTEALDLWLLFPVMAVQRMLARDGDLPDSWVSKLNGVFGDPGWRDAFYKAETVPDPMKHGHQTSFLESGTTEPKGPGTIKVATMDKVKDYFIQRLEKIFPYVAPNPLPLVNTSGSILFFLCFAVSSRNEAAQKTASKIAGYILRKKQGHLP